MQSLTVKAANGQFCSKFPLQYCVCNCYILDWHGKDVRTIFVHIVCLFKHNKSSNNYLVSTNFRVTVIIYSLYNIYPTKTLCLNCQNLPRTLSNPCRNPFLHPNVVEKPTIHSYFTLARARRGRGRDRMVVGLHYLCNQCPSPLMSWARTPLRRGVLDTALCDKVCQWLTVARCFSTGTPVSSTNKTDRQDITEIFLNVALNNINLIQTISKGVVFSIKIEVLLRNKIIPNVIYDCADSWCHIGL